jgi:hypothetical protein
MSISYLLSGYCESTNRESDKGRQAKPGIRRTRCVIILTFCVFAAPLFGRRMQFPAGIVAKAPPKIDDKQGTQPSDLGRVEAAISRCKLGAYDDAI